MRMPRSPSAAISTRTTGHASGGTRPLVCVTGCPDTPLPVLFRRGHEDGEIVKGRWQSTRPRAEVFPQLF
jgi:hypothetical protein